ncbi:bowman-birk serine protease inhibitor family protein (macronuclear) [Tetrahymena thermophila SB210]|uniref:Bowman-birk serine protease inhibitor family protein n=1 Tax=Tetrahymena thermophila (strain SB210) TaxID=312017 RepID=I7MEX9_TETTS|nr:bowman-birk serine protease inhibitor family protein [Tetrahymena thermophila SB210]EAR98006.3 bowman-birk serine protease inhibitor family protein [Tetrahymena thermophila SB210]|eukprot:XP_001018251.3 bowman-birk serine protease inhibitor family protein [Tetrahymena thermophila SB210]
MVFDLIIIFTLVITQMMAYKQSQYQVNNSVIEFLRLDLDKRYDIYLRQLKESCNSDEYFDGKVCQKCHPTCLSCNGPNFNQCLDCDISKFRKISGSQQCNCIEGYYDNMNNCTKCDQSCLSCSGSSDKECLTCDLSKFRYLKDGQCVCQDTYYDKGDKNICEKCQNPCKNCILQGLNILCLSCLDNLKILQLGKCICQDRFYEDNQKNCQKCINNCLICQDSTTCNKCDQNRQFQNNKCQCLTGFYDDGSNCQKCDSTCQECSGPSSLECTQCDSSKFRTLKNNQCVCKEGYFYINSYDVSCLQCYNKCETCKSGQKENNICLTCRPTDNRILQNNSCQCKQGYFESLSSSSTICDQCQPRCLTCSNKTTCDSCDQSLQLILNSSNQCVCKDGYYEDNGLCKLCHYSCEKCNGPGSNNCTSCIQSKNRIFKQNQCICLDSYYDDGSNQQCQKCHYSCYTCNNNQPDSCKNCGNSLKNYRIQQQQINLPSQSQFKCICQDQYYDDGSNNICDKCHYSCKTCSQQNICTNCDQSSFRQLQQLEANKIYCLCQIGYFEDSNKICQQCSQNCKSCEKQKDQCTDCRQDMNRVLNNKTKKCDCKDGMYEDKSGICQICHFSCDTCEGGGSVNDCKTCNYQNNRVPQQKDSKITCQCMQTFYDSNKAICDKCHYSCLTCSKNSNENSCDSCDSSLFRVLNSGKCICKSGYVEVNQTCVPCHKSCQECIGITNKDCTKCNMDDQRVQSVKDQTSFQCFCKSSYYEDSNLICQKCHFSCQECIGPKAEDCTQCSRQNFRIPSELSLKNFFCVCQEKFYSDNINSLCLSCHYSCKNCEGGNNKQNCTECNQSFGRIKLLQQGQNQGQCICKEAFFDNGSNELCTACDITCKNCFNSSNQGCNQCYDDRNFMLTQQKQCICKPQHFYNQIQNACLKCHEFCQSCKGLGKEDCLSCFPYQNRELIGTQCLCKQSFFQINQNSICQACHYSCLNCNGYSRIQCTDCSSDSLRIFNRMYSTCDCQQGYFEIKNTQKCQKCDQNCKTCEMKSDKCIQCNNNMVLNKESYKCECQSGYYLDIKENSCYPCSYACKQCLGPQNGQCLTCKDNYLGLLSGIFNNLQTYQCICDPNCPQNMQLTPIQTINNIQYQICVCMEGFYEDIILLKCLKCHFTCQTCVGPSAQDCLSCKDEDLNFRQAKPVLDQNLVECSCKKGYFEIQNQLKCQKCHSSCETCQGQFNYCISCPENSFISQNGVCICKQNFIFMSTLGICQQCHHSCNQCDGLQLDDCLSCSSLTTRVFVPKNANMKNSLGTCKCQQGYYDIGDSECQKCHYSCETCIGQANFCMTCPPQKLSHRFYSSNGKCDCLPKYFEDVNNNCVPCPYDCYTCNLEKKCLTCEESQRQLDTKTNRCTCYKGTFEVQDRSCQPCDLNCESCKDNPKVCSTCHPNSYLNYFSKCVCNEGFYEDPEFYKQYSMIPRKQISILNKTDLCKKCFTTCKSCDNKLTCLSCDVMKFTVLNPKTKICECFYGRQLILKEDGSFTCELLNTYITQSKEQQISTIHELISKIMNYIYIIFGFLSFMSIFTGNLTLPNIMLQRVFDIELLLYLNVMPIDNVKQFLSTTNKSIYMYIGYINPFQNILSSEDDYYISNNLKEYKISTNIYKQGGGAIIFVLSLYLIHIILRKTVFHNRYTLIDQYYKAIHSRILLARLYNLYYINVFYSLEGILSYLLLFYSFLGATDSRLFFKVPSIFIICFFTINYAYKIKFCQNLLQDPYEVIFNSKKLKIFSFQVYFARQLTSLILFYLYFSQQDQWQIVWILVYKILICIPILAIKYKNKSILKINIFVQELIYASILIFYLLLSVQTKRNILNENDRQQMLKLCLVFKIMIVSLVLLSTIFLFVYVIYQLVRLFIQKYDYKSNIFIIQQKLYSQNIVLSDRQFRQNQENYIFKIQIQPKNENSKSELSANLQNKLEITSY